MGDRLFARWGPALTLALLAACSQSTPAVELDQPLPPEQFQACVQNLANETALSGRPLKRDDFEQIAANAHYDDRVRQGLLVQAGEPTYWWDNYFWIVNLLSNKCFL